MPFRVEPIQDGAILDTAYSGNVVLDDLKGLCDAGAAHLDGSSFAFVHVMMDLSEVKTHPTNILSMVNVSRQLLEHPKIGWWVVYGIQSSFVSVIVKVIANSKLIKLKQFNNQTDALAFLTQRIGVR